MNNEYDNLIVETDKLFDYAILRNVGFVEILYNAEDLIRMGVATYNEKRLGQPWSNANNNQYINKAYPGATEDLETFLELLDQIAIRVEQNVNSAHACYGMGRPIGNVYYHDCMLLVTLG